MNKIYILLFVYFILYLIVCKLFTPVLFFSLYLDLQPLTVTLALIGKAGSSMAFGIAFIFTGELLPTVVRTAAMGTCSSAARIGAMLAPYIAKSVTLPYCFRYQMCLE